MQNGWPKLKAISEQNRQQQPQQQQGQGFQQQPQQQAPPQQRQAPQQDNRQDSIQFAQALNLAVSEYVNGKGEEASIDERTNIYYRVLKTRVFPMRMTHGHQQEQQQPPQQPAPQDQQPQQPYDPNAAFIPTDDIPF
jgi:hypothetical protein